MDNYLGVKESAAYLGCAKRTIYRRIKKGKWPNPDIVICGKRFWSKDTLDGVVLNPQGSPILLEYSSKIGRKK